MTSSSNGSSGKAFHSYPQKYPKARGRASTMVAHIFNLTKKGPRTLVGTIVDISFHATQGYVTCTTQLGIVNVYGIPIGSVVPQMRVFCRQMGSAATNRSFVFDGFASNLSGLGQSGAFLFANPIISLSTGLALSPASAMPTSSALTSAQGYFWYWFFYLPQMPTSTVTIWQMAAASGGNVLTAQYLPTGYLRISSQDGHGYISAGTLAPHNMHWIVMQPGINAQSLIIDGVAPIYNGIFGSGDNPTFNAGGTAYQLSLLSNRDGTGLCPIGSWISKFGFGVGWDGFVITQLPSIGSGIGGRPTDDTELPTANAPASITVNYQLLCDDTPGSTTLANSAPGGGNNAVISSGGVVSSTGPY